MPKLIAILSVLIMGASMCGQKPPELPAKDAGAGSTAAQAAPVQEGYIERTNRNLGNMKRDLQQQQDGRENQVETQIQRGNP